jgi:flagellar basal body rod protein FlgB
MIYIRRLNFCFIRVPKTASQAILYFLYKNVYTKHDITSKNFNLNKLTNTLAFTEHNISLTTGHLTAQEIIENNIASSDTNFYAVIRCPFERQLSLYMYKIKNNDYGKVYPSPKHFRSLIKKGVLHDKKPYRTLPQHKFLEFNGISMGTWWSYNNIEQNLYEFCKSNNINITYKLETINTSPGKKDKLIDIFYSADLKQDVYLAYKKDFEIYEKVK